MGGIRFIPPASRRRSILKHNSSPVPEPWAVPCGECIGDSIAKANLAAYTTVKAIRWEGAWCRKDIADKALEWEMSG